MQKLADKLQEFSNKLKADKTDIAKVVVNTTIDTLDETLQVFKKYHEACVVIADLGLESVQAINNDPALKHSAITLIGNAIGDVAARTNEVVNLLVALSKNHRVGSSLYTFKQKFQNFNMPFGFVNIIP